MRYHIKLVQIISLSFRLVTFPFHWFGHSFLLFLTVQQHKRGEAHSSLLIGQRSGSPLRLGRVSFKRDWKDRHYCLFWAYKIMVHLHSFVTPRASPGFAGSKKQKFLYILGREKNVNLVLSIVSRNKAQLFTISGFSMVIVVIMPLGDGIA